jgi:hypothetical protein
VLEVEINDIKEQRSKGSGDAAIASTVKADSIKNLEDQLKTVESKAELIST